MQEEIFLGTPPGAVTASNERSYCLQGVHDREALVFKSMVRLLSHRTKHVWIYSPLSTELRVVAEGQSATAAHLMPAQQVLTLGTAPTKRHSYLQLPLHAHELEAELNRLGALIAPTHTSETASAHAHIEPAPMRMLRWPPASVLTTATRMRLATLMAGKPLTVYELQQRSKEDLAACTAFFDDLQRHHLLVPVMSPALGASAAGHSAVHSTNGGTTTALPTAPPTTPAQIPVEKKSLALPSLLERIRMRLGIANGEPSSRANRA